jgi:hypothetical protein
VFWSISRATISAAATTAPEVSLTEPTMFPKVDWAHRRGTPTKRANERAKARSRRTIGLLLLGMRSPVMLLKVNLVSGSNFSVNSLGPFPQIFPPCQP